MKRAEPVIAIGLDAVEGSLVDRMLDAGRLPNLAELRERGASAEVRTRPEGFLSMVWPTLFTGSAVGAHGWYFNKLWSPSDQRLRYVDTSWLPTRPFWEDLGPEFRTAILDVPFSPKPAPGFNGVFLNGWQAHDDFGKSAVPHGLHRELRRRFGAPAMGPELFGPQNARTLVRQSREGIESLGQFAQVVRDLLTRERWDLTLAVLGGAHRALHYVWSLDEADLSGAEPERLERLRGAREEIYVAADRAVGTILERAPRDARVLVFALHGMGRNCGWAEHFYTIVSHIHGRGRDTRAKEGLIYGLKKALPWEWVRQVTMRLPSTVNHALVPLWSRRMLDWSSTRFFALPLDLNGYLRINLRGREAEGIVEPGAELEELLDELTEDFMSLRDLRDGRPIVADVYRVDDLVGAEAPRRYMLPDLIVRWTDTYATGSPGVSSRYGEVRWDPDAPLPSGRSGNHTKQGWLIAAGPGIRRGTLPASVDAVDLAPTLLAWMGAPIPDRLEGSPVEALGGAGSGTKA
jgi:predicted AlkP superfamily phosphohydrolase/phosphomutase